MSYHLSNTLLPDGSLDVFIIGNDGTPLARGTFRTGEEAIAAAREWWSQQEQEMEQDEPEISEEA